MQMQLKSEQKLVSLPKSELLPDTDPLLRVEIPEFNFDEPWIDPEEFSKYLIDEMVRHRGYGLSANQIGYAVRAFAFGNPDDEENLRVVFNPRIVYMSEDKILLDEGCLSFPDLFIKIKRPNEIRVRHYDAQGNMFTEKLSGISARIFQHELDHLNGITFTDVATRYHLDKGKKSRKLIRRKNNG